MRTGWKILVVGLTALGALNVADARPRAAATFMTGGEIADAPTGFDAMCARDSILCDAGIRASEPARDEASLTPAPAPAISTEIERAAAPHVLCDVAWTVPVEPVASFMLPQLYSAPLAFASPFAPRPSLAFAVAWRVRSAGCADPAKPDSFGLQTAVLTIKTPTGALAPVSGLARGDDRPSVTQVSAPTESRPAIRRDSGAPTPPADRQTLEKMLKRVNALVNRNVIQVSDMTSAGVPEFWQRAGTRRGSMGDCEDIAIEKRFELIDAGFPPARLFLAVAFSARYGMHTLLIARLETGDVVLDSLSAKILPWTETPYVFVRRQSTDNPRVWRRVGEAIPEQLAARDSRFPPRAAS